MGVRGANCRANSQSTRPDHQCPARGRGPQRCMDAYKVRTRRDSGTAARWFLIRFLECVLINAGIGRMSALGVNRTRRDGGNDVNDPERTLAILSRSRRFIFRCFRDHAYFVSIGAGPRRSWSAAEKATSIAESYGAGETGLWCRAASRSNVAAAVRLAAAGQADRSVCAGHIHPGGGTGGCVTAERRPLAIRYSASTSIGPPVSPKSRRTSSRTARRRSSDKAANAWPVEAPPRSNGP